MSPPRGLARAVLICHDDPRMGSRSWKAAWCVALLALALPASAAADVFPLVEDPEVVNVGPGPSGVLDFDGDGLMVIRMGLQNCFCNTHDRGDTTSGSKGSDVLCAACR
jgi:hypothetical protein